MRGINNTPSKPDRAASSYSTPLTHNAVARLRGNVSHDRSALTPQTTSSDSQDSSSYATPRSRRQSGSQFPALAAATPRTPSNNTPSKRKGAVRIVRGPQKPWYDRIARLPIDLWDRYELQLNEFILTDIEKLEDFAYPIAFATLGMHFFLRITLGASSALSSTRSRGSTSARARTINKYANTAEAKLEELRLSTQGRIASWGSFKTLIYRSTTLLCWSLVLLSILNAFWLFTNRRKYKLFLQEGSVNSPNAKRVVLSTPTQTEDDQTSGDSEETASLLLRISTWIWSQVSRQKIKRNLHEVQELSVWTPPNFALRFFAIYSPPVALLIQFLDRSNFFTFFTAIAFLVVQTYIITHSFSQMVKDRQTVNREVMHEYNAKFVAPRIHYARRDASTMTNEAEMLDLHAHRHRPAKGRHSMAVSTSAGYY